MIDNNVGRTWSNAPSGVRDARTLAWLGVILSGIGVIAFFVLLTTAGFHGATFATLIMFLYVLFFPLYVWLLGGLKKGARSAYFVQMVIAIIGLLSFPLGTLINGYILYKWFRPETKAWFGV